MNHADTLSALTAPLTLRPVYQTVVWGGHRLAQRRAGVPAGPIGEAWDVSDHPRGHSVVTDGPLAGRTLGELRAAFPEAVVGPGVRADEPFPLLVKLIDAADRLSVQVHPDDALARLLGDGDHGKTECWLAAESGGELFVGATAGTTAASFEGARLAGTLEGRLNRFSPSRSDFYFLPARTVHAIGAGCLLWEVQQTSDITYRVFDWGRVGLDGQPRPLHVEKSLQTIDFDAEPVVRMGAHGLLARCPYFSVALESLAGATRTLSHDAATVVMTLDAPITVETAGGATRVPAYSAVLVPAAGAAHIALQAEAPTDVFVATVSVRAQ